MNDEKKTELEKFVPESAPAIKPDAANPALIEAAKEALELQNPIDVAIVPAESVHKTENPKVEVPPGEAARIVVVAHDAQEMGTAQKKLITWVEAKMVEQKVELEDAEKNLSIYKKNKWRTEPLAKLVTKIQKMYGYYEKMKAALEAGYVIIPNFPEQTFSVFAIKTKKKNPRQNRTSGDYSWPKDQRTDSPPFGEGRYVSPGAFIHEHSFQYNDKDGKSKTGINRWAEEFKGADFPMMMAKPEVLEDAAHAMRLGIFDELIISPALPGRQTVSRRTRSGDPMVMGRIVHREGYSTKSVTFLITWFVDTKDL